MRAQGKIRAAVVILLLATIILVLGDLLHRSTSASTLENAGVREETPAVDLDLGLDGDTPGRAVAPDSSGSTPATGHYIVRVLAASTGAPIHGALIIPPSGARSVGPEDEIVVARSGDDGRAIIPPGAIGCGPLLVVASGFLPSDVSLADARGLPATVYMHPGNGLTARCSDPSGQALAGCVVVASQVQLPGNTELQRIFREAHAPGTNRSRIHWAISDAGGAAALSGLTPGEYKVSVQREAHVVVEKSPEGLVTVPEQAEVLVELWPLCATVLSVTPDTIITYALDLDGVSTASRNSEQLAVIGRTKRLLEATFPGCAVGVFVAPCWSNAGSSAQALLLTHPRGLGRAAVGLRTVAEIDGPMEPALRYEPIAGGCHRIQVSIEDGLGKPVGAGTFALSGADNLSIPLAPGPAWVPAGRYRVQCNDHLLSREFEPEEVVIPGPVDIRVRPALTPCSIEVLDGSNVRHTQFGLSISSLGRTKTMFVLDSDQHEFLLPAAPAYFVAKLRGLQIGRAHLDVPAGVDAHAITIHVVE